MTARGEGAESELMRGLRERVERAGARLRDEARLERPRGTRDKQEVDGEIEAELVEGLAAEFPEDGFLCEEGHSRRGSGEREWIIDPQDGTGDFWTGARETSISVAARVGRELTLGLVHLPCVSLVRAPRLRDRLTGLARAAGETDLSAGLTIAVEGSGPILINGRPGAAPTPLRTLRDAPSALVSRKLSSELFADNAEAVHPARLSPCASIATRLALVAAGAVELTWTLGNGLEVWDFAGGLALLRAAGGVLLGPAGEGLDLDNGVGRSAYVAARDPALGREVCRRLAGLAPRRFALPSLRRAGPSAGRGVVAALRGGGQGLARGDGSAGSGSGDVGQERLADFARRLGRVEARVAAQGAAAFRFTSDGFATLEVDGRRHDAGRFSTPSIDELRRRLGRGARGPAIRPALYYLEGRTSSTDIGQLQADAEGGTLFQVASQFNALEAPQPGIVPVVDYLHDPTQGPRAALSAWPGALLRTRAAPGDGDERFAQSEQRSINLLADALDPALGAPRGGYLRPTDIQDTAAARRCLEQRFGAIRIGLHEGLEVCAGGDRIGLVPEPHPRIHQALTSTLALGGYGRAGWDPELVAIARLLLRAAYTGTLLAALDCEAPAVVLTLIGGGVFGNEHSWIHEAIFAALDEVDALADRPLSVVVNLRGGLSAAPRQRLETRARELGSGGLIHVERGRIGLPSEPG